ncbi:MAG TPA: dephospho-CoA kinase [Casimicrobiaceae bacterium]|nr:dephospho-CoA kinase [Casimicrobiaceae bacterium]
MPYVVGLTGGIGSGKTAVANAFANLGIEVVDTDALAHRLSAVGQPGYAAIRAALRQVPVRADGEIDRAALRRLVFADAQARARLEAALHPLIGAEARKEVEAWKGSYGLIVVPLLLERGGLRSIVERILVVDCSAEQQVLRAVARSGLSPEEVRSIMATQWPRERRLAAADDVVDNAGELDAIAPQVLALDQRYRELAASRPAG